MMGGCLGILGGGQLGRMMAIAAREMGYRIVVWDPSPGAPTAPLADTHIIRPLDDLGAAEEMTSLADVVTYEFENVSTRLVQAIQARRPVYPSLKLLEASSHRVREKSWAVELGIPTAGFMAVESLEDLGLALKKVGVPAVLKTASGGYDGKGQRVVNRPEEAQAFFQDLEGGKRDLIWEERVDFDCEISVAVARDQSGRVETYPVTENHHRSGILDLSVVPACVSSEVQDKAKTYASQLARTLDLVGVMAVEFFVMRDGRVLMNEIAPRPHNSYHWTIEGASISQFRQHVRAVMGLPLDRPRLLTATAMVNLLGERFIEAPPDLSAALGLEGVAIHLYGKDEPRPGRKMGHLTAMASSATEARDRALEARKRMGGEVPFGTP